MITNTISTLIAQGKINLPSGTDIKAGELTATSINKVGSNGEFSNTEKTTIMGSFQTIPVKKASSGNFTIEVNSSGKVDVK